MSGGKPKTELVLRENEDRAGAVSIVRDREQAHMKDLVKAQILVTLLPSWVRNSTTSEISGKLRFLVQCGSRWPRKGGILFLRDSYSSALTEVGVVDHQSV